MENFEVDGLARAHPKSFTHPYIVQPYGVLVDSVYGNGVADTLEGPGGYLCDYLHIPSKGTREEGRWRTPSGQLVVARLAENGELFDYVALRDGTAQGMAEPYVRRTVRHILCALLHMQRHGVSHRDLKPENLLIDGRGRCCIADFGSVRVGNVREATTTRYRKSEEHGHRVGMTPGYMPPEVSARRRIALPP